MKNCKHCNGTKLTLSGIVKNKQRYRCKDCGKTSRDGDKRIVHSLEKKIKVIKSYLEGVDIRWHCCIPNYILLYLLFLDNKIVKLC